jgi:hypothetical protein
MRTGNIMIGAVKSGKIVFDGHKRVFYKDEKGDNFVAFVSGYDEITTDPGNSDEITKKLQSWAKRKGFKINKGIGAFKLISIPKSEINKMTQGQIFVKIMNHEKKRTYTNVTFKNLVNRLSYLETMDFKRYRKHSI